MRAALMIAAALAMAPDVACAALPEMPREPPKPTPEELQAAMARLDIAARKRQRKGEKRRRDFNRMKISVPNARVNRLAEGESSGTE